MAAEARALAAEKAQADAERKAQEQTQKMREGMDADRIVLETEHRKEWDQLSAQLAVERQAREEAERRVREVLDSGVAKPEEEPLRVRIAVR
jgi:hypothetical protein